MRDCECVSGIPKISSHFFLSPKKIKFQTGLFNCGNIEEWDETKDDNDKKMNAADAELVTRVCIKKI